MKIVFNGLLEKKQGGGCNCKRVASSLGFVNQRMYTLPSGQSKTFFVGKVEEVSERDGKFLLSYISYDSGGQRQVFTKVED